MAEALNIVPKAEDVETGVANRDAIAQGLSDILADTYRLIFKTHAYHWNVTGPLFFSLHKLTEEQYQDMFGAADEVAERIRALGKLAPAQFAELEKNSVLKDKEDLPSVGGMVTDLAEDHERVAHRLHALIRLADAGNDDVTADLATARSAFHEKAAWMLRAIASE